MWLRPTDRPPTLHPAGGWAIRMLSQESPVMVRVTEEALQDVGPSSALTAPIYKYRNVFEEIADKKFNRHEFEPDGSITIKSADVKHV
ncbi:MAG TPA: hypothetical protein VIJ59_06870 [Caulobacteraceae bacterium]